MKKIYLLLFLLAITSCQQEELSRIEETSSPTREKASLEEINFNDLPEGIFLYLEGKKPNVAKRSEREYPFGEIRKDMPARKFVSEEGIISYTLVLETVEHSQPQSASTFYFDNLVFYPKNDGDNLVHIIRYVPTEEWYNNSRDFKDFTGTIIFYRSTGEEIESITLTKGKTTKGKNKSSSSAECYLEIERGPDFCVGGLEEVVSGEVYGDGEEDCIETYIYKLVCTMGGGDDYDPYDSAPPEPGQLPSIGGTAPTLPQPIVEEDKIVNNLQGQDKCVYNKLKELNLFKETIGVFDNNDDYILNITYGDCAYPGADACADGGEIGNGIVTIIIESVGQGTLDFAASLLHEGIHAEIYKYVEEHRKGIDPSKRTNLLYYYFHYKAKNRLDLGTTEAQHQYMADNFVKPIARGIQQLDGFRYDLEHYMGFGWDGLRAYGYDGYYDEGEWVDLNKDESSDYYKTQRNVLETTKFPTTCEE